MDYEFHTEIRLLVRAVNEVAAAIIRSAPEQRAYGQEAAATDDDPPLMLVKDQADLAQLAVQKFLEKFDSLSDGTHDDIREALAKEVYDALASVVDFRNDSEKKLAKAFAELSQLRRECNQAKLQGMKAARNLSVAVFASNTENAAFKKFVVDLDQLIEMNKGGRN